MQKIIGSVLVIIGSSFLGYSKALGIKNRLDSLNVFKMIFNDIKSEIIYSASSLPELFQKVGRYEGHKDIEDFFITVGNMLKSEDKHTFKEVWNRCINTKLSNCALIQKDIDIIAGFGSDAGYLNRQILVNSIDNLLEHLDNNIVEIRNDIKEKTRVYRCIGVAFGVFVVIILL